MVFDRIAPGAADAFKHRQHLSRSKRAREQQAELAHAGRVLLLGELAASLAHELKQPLTAILTNAQAAIRLLDTDSGEVREILRDIASEDRRAGEIIDRMRAMLMKNVTRMERRDLNVDVQEVLLLMRSNLASRRTSVETRLSPELPLVRGDHIQLQQVLLNLVMNGCDAMHANPTSDRRLVIETSRGDGSRVHVSVADRGAGITPNVLEHIFEPFYSTKDSGLGMGLAICKSIISAHGGELWATNNPDRGATFHFVLN